jgi:hypothetical protein
MKHSVLNDLRALPLKPLDIGVWRFNAFQIFNPESAYIVIQNKHYYFTNNELLPCNHNKKVE